MNCRISRTATATALLLAGFACLPARTTASEKQPHREVAVSEDDTTFTLDNGIVTARVLKKTGSLASLFVRGEDMLTPRSGRAGGYWSHDTTGASEVITRTTVDPKANGGAVGEVSVKAISGGRKLGFGPGAPKDGNIAADIETRYTLVRGESGVYTYCIFDHRPEYPGAAIVEARFATKASEIFDWISVDEQRHRYYPASEGFGDKYIYTAVQFDNPVFGWASVERKVGFWLINPSVEYLSGGPTKVEFLCHRNTTPDAAPVILNYWRSSHYAGASVEVADGEPWSKVIGPFLLYANSGGDPDTLRAEARAKGALEASRWPYAWVSGVDYPRSAERATVSGRVILRDPLTPAPAGAFGRLMVGLTAPAYVTPSGRPIDWQTDAKHYQFWVRGGPDGRFTIPAVRAGTYTLHAFADGVPGEFVKTDVAVAAGASLDLSDLAWTPAHRGVLVWQVGIPNRSASEFAGGDRPFDPEMPLEYARRFPNDVTFIVGRSDPARDWFFQHVPHNEDPNARPVNYRGVPSPGRATPFTIRFTLDEAPAAEAWLRLGFCGTGTRELTVSVNDQPAGTVPDMVLDGVIPRHGSLGLYYERELAIPASMLRAGENALTLTVPAGPVNNGVIYDYVRLELSDTAAPASVATAKPDAL